MPRRATAVLILVCALIALAPPRAAAQSHGTEIYGGYSYLDDPSNAVLAVTARDNVFHVGWVAGAARPAWRWLTAVGEASGHYKRRTSLDDDINVSFHALMGGGRVSARIGRVSEFAQILAGVTHASASAFGITTGVTALSLQPGGGVDYPLASRLSARLELDYRWLQQSADGRAHASQLRAAVALVYR